MDLDAIMHANWLTLITLLIQCGVFSVSFKFIYNFLKDYREKDIARDEALRSLLRCSIISIYHKTEETGFLPIYNLENIEDMYKAYKTLGGNGAITELYTQIKKYPHNNPPGH